MSHLKLKLEDDSSGIIQEILMNFFRIWVESFWQQKSLHLFVTPFPFLLALLALLTPAANSQELERLLILPAAGLIHRGYLRPIMRAANKGTDEKEDVQGSEILSLVRT
ncbi:uncharacterized protein LOC132190334 [Corylus avellana]|uniref:uncharacterized protein LOC132190334 n=1 Tax=Corylus avellana TaxID=13451 RepID=UPI00286B7CE4|nr:uncharacterized protein LOC132190334 [Corylus avellana]